MLLWWLDEPTRLSSESHDAIAEPRNRVSVSAAAAWEIFLKKSLGKLDAPDDLEGALGDAGFDQLFITIRHAERTSHLPAIHQDPFDRMQIAQAQVEGLLLVTRDETVMRYDVPVIRA